MAYNSSMEQINANHGFLLEINNRNLNLLSPGQLNTINMDLRSTLILKDSTNAT